MGQPLQGGRHWPSFGQSVFLATCPSWGTTQLRHQHTKCSHTGTNTRPRGLATQAYPAHTRARTAYSVAANLLKGGVKKTLPWPQKGGQHPPGVQGSGQTRAHSILLSHSYLGMPSAWPDSNHSSRYTLAKRVKKAARCWGGWGQLGDNGRRSGHPLRGNGLRLRSHQQHTYRDP